MAVGRRDQLSIARQVFKDRPVRDSDLAPKRKVTYKPRKTKNQTTERTRRGVEPRNVVVKNVLP